MAISSNNVAVLQTHRSLAISRAICIFAKYNLLIRSGNTSQNDKNISVLKPKDTKLS